MQGLWSAHRKAKINLNASSAPTSSGSTPLHTPANEDPTPTSTPPTERAATDAAAGPDVDVSAPSSDARAAGGKRKVRSTRANGEESSKRPKLGGHSGAIAKDYTPPTTRLSDLGGIDACVDKMLELVAMPLCHPEIYIHTGVQPPRGVLLHGPPGCGKTLLAHAIAGVSLKDFSLPLLLRSV